MARPTKNGGNDKRELIVPVRFSVEEKSKIDTHWKSSGMRYLSDYLRRKIFGGDTVQTTLFPEREILIRCIAHLGKVGSNLNQIAKVLNKRELSGEKIDVSPEQVTQTLVAVDKLVNYLLGNISRHGSKRKATR